MYITSVELENIKSHAKSRFEFQRGTTAILGENGAGKTTLIEAIAWVLFDLLDYKKDTFLRRGAKKGSARVTFESGLDERDYLVYRDTGTGYYVYDPKIKTRVADKKEEVQRFLWQHMGLEPGTDLESLFRRAVGVPQGTFTAIFLETPAERKRAFDRLLKVEEYRQSAEKLIDTINHIKTEIREVENRVSFAEGKLEDVGDAENQLKVFAKEEESLGKVHEKLEQTLKSLRDSVAGMDTIESKLAKIREALEGVKNAISKSEVAIARKETDFKNSETAFAKLKKVEAKHGKHIAALGMLKELERERGERERLGREIADIDGALARVRAEQKTNSKDLERVTNARREIEKLRPLIEKQKGLEGTREDLRSNLAGARAAENRLAAIERELEELRGKFRLNKKERKDAEEKSRDAGGLQELIKQDDELRRRLAGLNGKLEVDLRFQREMQNGLCPILSEKCLNLKKGETLEGFLSSQFENIRSEIGKAESEQKRIAGAISSARAGEEFRAKLEPLRQRGEEIEKEGTRLKDEKKVIEQQTAGIAPLEKQLERTEKDLKDLDNPAGRVKILESELTKEFALREMKTKIESNLERLTSEKRLKEEQLQSYKDLDFNWKKNTEIRDATVEANREFLANEAQAGLVENRRAEYDSSLAALKELIENRASLDEDLKNASGGYDAGAHSKLKADTADKEKEAVRTKANLDNFAERRKELEEKLKGLKEIRKRLEFDLKEKKRLEAVEKATAFIRLTLKEAAPRVARNYVYHVSMEANQMFRDITGNAEHTLKWEEDYGIALEEGGFDRPFQSLSGGEQMAAALSVRLALLKQLSDISLAFFDEPTTNLDLERRERLAEQISQITENRTFEQMFVISHDDTFESYVDNVIIIKADGD